MLFDKVFCINFFNSTAIFENVHVSKISQKLLLIFYLLVVEYVHRWSSVLSCVIIYLILTCIYEALLAKIIENIDIW